jgi:hypothetical protein
MTDSRTKPASKAPPGAKANHAMERHGSVRSPRLRVVQPVQLPPDWEMQPGVPATRADCVGGPRPCPFVSCSQHLWLRLQSEQPGNPKAGKQGATTLRPSSAHSCALDVADRGAMSIDEIAEAFGMHHSRVRQIAEGAILKLFSVDPVLAAKLLEAL